MKYKLKSKLILSYILLSLFIIGLISFSMKITIQREFENYVITNQTTLTESIMTKLINSYTDNKTFDLQLMEAIGVSAIEDGLIIQIEDINSNVLWSATTHNAGLCEIMITNIRENMYNYYTNWNGEYTEKSFKLLVNDKTIGTLTTGYVGPYYFNDQEINFLETTNKVLIYIGVISFVLATIIGLLVARSITLPINKVISFLDAINHNKTVDETALVSNSVELQLLYQSAFSLEERIIKQEKLRKQLTQDMAHELKTPLTAILGQLEAMIDGIFDITTDRLNGCHEELIRIKDLINEIEELSLIENNNLTLDKKSFDLKVIIEELKKLFSAELSLQHMQLTFEHVSSIDRSVESLIYGDEAKIRQALYNLLSNSIKYAGKDTTITITYNNTPDFDNIITFKDNGKGISDYDLAFVFERFYRGDMSRTGHKGLGIGLTLVKSIIEQHMGTITVSKNAFNETLFEIRLPNIKKEIDIYRRTNGIY